MRAAYQLRRMRAIRLHVSSHQPRVLQRFVPLTATDLARGATDHVLFLGDVRFARDERGVDSLVHAPGCAVPGQLAPPMEPRAIPAPFVAAHAVHPSGSIRDVGVDVLSGSALAPLALGIFVYGTLMQGEEREGAIRSVLPDATPVEGSIAGGLVHLGAWPGLVGGEGRVHGELFQPAEFGPLLAVLDPIEGFQGYGATPTEYVRVVVPVTTAEGVAWAWTYRYVADTHGALPIPSGRWRDVPRRLPGTAGMRRPTDAV